MKKLVIGLGNPGLEFKGTPHNLGFQFLDQLRKTTQAPSFQESLYVQAQITETKIGKEEVILAKPQTFMNKSGESVKLLKETLHIPLKNIWVIHDDLDIPLGTFKIVHNRGAAGHKGVISIIQTLHSQDFYRLRLGVKPKNYIQNRTAFVLRKMSLSQHLIIRRTIKQAIPVLEKQLQEKQD